MPKTSGTQLSTQALRTIIRALLPVLTLGAVAIVAAASANAVDLAPQPDEGLRLAQAGEPAAPSSPLGIAIPGAGSTTQTQKQSPSETTRRSFLPPGNSAGQAPSTSSPGEQTRSEPGMVTKAWVWLMRQQQAVTRQLSQGVRNFRTMDPFSAAWILALISFTYGVLHAAGPGHGKAVISSYVLANEQTVKRGIILSFMAAGVQAMSAIVIVGVLAIALNQTGMQIKAAEGTITTASWAFVALIGAYLVYLQLRGLFGTRTVEPRPVSLGAQATADLGTDAVSSVHSHGKAAEHHHNDHHAGCSHHHAHDHSPEHHGQGCGHDHHQHARNHHTHDHHAHDHAPGEACPSCGHAHMPSPDQIQGQWSWGKALAIALAVGIRPCTGAIIVMIFALTQGLFWAGVFSTFAMAIGTAITVSALAALAVGSKKLAMRYASASGGAWASRIQTGLGLLGSTLILLIGAVFFFASLQTQTPF